MHIEEYLLVRKYPEYREYKRRVKKLVPFVY
jgi:protein-S-isoprenylcysteine O-methyltransferase Ste14